MSENPGWQITLDEGLVMRGATPDDVDRLAEYNAEMHAEPDEYPGPAFWIAEWTRDLLTKPHPTMSLDDVIIVEDSKAGQIVSSCVYFQQTWSYCGIPVPFGRPEIVSTHPDYRNRGLIRRQFELMHRWGDERGHLVQGITGIPYYYRQFGYEMALEIPVGRTAALSQLPAWKEGDERSVLLRKAERSDVSLIHQLYQSSKQRSLFTPDASEAEIEYQLFDRNGRSALSYSPWIIEDGQKQAVGFMVLKAIFPLQFATVYALNFTDASMHRALGQPFLKSLRELLENLHKGDEKPVTRVTFQLFEAHPSLPFLGSGFAAAGRPYAWYVRTPDLPELLRQVAPKLEERLAGTQFEGLTDNKILSFYRSGLGLEFEQGKLVTVAKVNFPERRDSAARLPDLTFLQLVFGRMSMGELADAMPDARARSQEDELLIDTLFPKMSSDTVFAAS